MRAVCISKSTGAISKIGAFLSLGEVVATPTETAYGLLADSTNTKAVARVVKIKGREPGKPIALMAADLKMVCKYFLLASGELRLANKFWPGPLTLLLKPKRKFPAAVVGPGGLIGVRVPGDVWLRTLIIAVGKPLTATSANRAGARTPYSARAVQRALAARGLTHLVDAGRLRLRPTSTVVRVRGQSVAVVRPGAVSERRLQRALGV